ncbi:MAG: hypothetical protein A2516_09090 [Alphaproteobacteria bacterium RIFOXYD12_FULL_60_8]|nr:MAG: hypothetical protein A2516_09090 [Alphaproteobacteria bacterium RIFOXYD12_FULL_60_8]
MNWTIALDILIVSLLIPTIAYAVILNGKLSALRKNRDDLAKVIQGFNEATLRAEAGIPKLRQAAGDASQSLHDEVAKAQALRDDLAYMVERGESLADRLESSVRAARGESKPEPKGVSAALSASQAEDKKRDFAADAPPSKREAVMPPSLRLGQEDKLGAGFAIDDDRSEAEKELLKALRTAR